MRRKFIFRFVVYKDGIDMAWPYRRWRRFFAPFDELFEQMERLFEEEPPWVKELMERGPTRVHKTPYGEIKEYGPYVYGFGITIGPDGKPKIREFGNVRRGVTKPLLREETEPHTDFVEEVDKLKVYAEIPGVSKEEIKLEATETTLRISAESKETGRKYYKDLELPCSVKPETSKAQLRNGILEVTFERKEARPPRGISVRID